jgi:hypothetical protein
MYQTGYLHKDYSWISAEKKKGSCCKSSIMSMISKIEIHAEEGLTGLCCA